MQNETSGRLLTDLDELNRRRPHFTPPGWFWSHVWHECPGETPDSPTVFVVCWTLIQIKGETR